MNGLGNDFVVVEARSAPFAPSAADVRAIADRASGIGCDQLIAIEPTEGADALMRFWNADGEPVAACGNGSRCVAWLLMQSTGRDYALLKTVDGRELIAKRRDERLVSVQMGVPGLDWRDIPLAEHHDTRELDVRLFDHPALKVAPGCVSMGNPHVVFFVEDVGSVPVEEIGAAVERHPLFPERVNVGFAQIKDRNRIRLRVWERGAGLTKACGTGACAALVAAARRNLTDHDAVVEVDGGELLIYWSENDDRVLEGVTMIGPVAVDFTGELP